MAFLDSSGQKYTAIWQAREPLEEDWIKEILGPFVNNYVTDGKHEVVLDNAILLDAFTFLNDPAYYEKFKGKNAFLVHFLDEAYAGRYEIYNNFRGVIRCFWSDIFDEQYVMKMPLGYTQGKGRGDSAVLPATQRKYAWSFVGQTGKATRPDAIEALSGVTPNFVRSTDSASSGTSTKSAGEEPKPLGSEEYSQLLSNSVFAPCPMGNVNIECFRTYEALEWGAVPIVEKRWGFDYYRTLLGDHPMPTVRSWSEARRMVEAMMKNGDEIDRVQRECLDWWDGFKRNYTERIGEFIETRSRTGGTNNPMVSKVQGIPGWRAVELVRHHNASALFRRVGLHARRLFKEKRLLVGFRPGIKLD
jgi:hypothetical protein